jgi:hypothetical protein
MRLRGWIRDLYERLLVHALPSRMPNFPDADDQDPIARFGKDHARRLKELREHASRRHCSLSRVKLRPLVEAALGPRR